MNAYSIIKDIMCHRYDFKTIINFCNKCEIANLCESLIEWYKNGTYNISFESGNTPITASSQQEYEFYKLRKSKINFIEFVDSEYDWMIYDFKIENLKIQEKVAWLTKDSGYKSQITKSGGTKNGKFTSQPYAQGDNDFYWFNTSDKITFYVVPEKVLIKHGYISTKKFDGKIWIFLTNKQWLNDYKFKYGTITEKANKARLLKLLGVKEKILREPVVECLNDNAINEKPKKVKKVKIIDKDEGNENPKKVQKKKPIKIIEK